MLFDRILSPSLYWGVRPTQTTGWAPPADLTNTSSSSNLVFPGGLPSRYWPGSTLFSFSGQPVLGCRVIWLRQPWCSYHGCLNGCQVSRIFDSIGMDQIIDQNIVKISKLFSSDCVVSNVSACSSAVVLQESWLTDLSQSRPSLSLPLHFLSTFCPIIIKNKILLNFK